MLMQPGRSLYSQTGGALLLVLVLIVLLSSTTTLALTSWSQALVTQHHFLHHQQQLTILNDYAYVINQWIQQHKEHLFLPLSSQQESWLIVNETIHSEIISHHIQISLYDGLAGIPPALANIGKAMHKTLPKSLQGVQLKTHLQYLEHNPRAIWRIPLLERMQRFPHKHATHQTTTVSPQHWSTMYVGELPDVTATQNPPASSVNLFDSDSTEESQASWASWISPYNDDTININTCPRPILEYIFDQASSNNDTHSHSIEKLTEDREVGLLKTVPQHLKNTRLPVKLVTQSDLFYAHVSITNHNIKENWFVIFNGEELHYLNIDK
ncbi:MAG: hypothetical protein HRU15_04390 [Planctomycetes bacterium]|nr:hypothetical protein [Planctomycetota bacterium]